MNCLSHHRLDRLGFRLLAVLLMTGVGVSLAGCTAFQTLLPGGPTMADAEWSGVKSGDVVSIVESLDPRSGIVSSLLISLGKSDPIGVLMPVTPIGESQPRWVLCAEKLAAKCTATADDFDD